MSTLQEQTAPSPAASGTSSAPDDRSTTFRAVEGGGESSFLGEVWYAEAESPVGPWAYAVKIITHDKYTFYNPKQHPAFAEEGGRRIYIDGTYSHDFSGNPDQTPRYDYNTIMYRLDVDDDGLILPAAVYRQADAPDATVARFAAESAEASADNAPNRSRMAFFACDRSHPRLIAVFADAQRAGGLTLERSGQGEPVFYALPAEMPDPPPTTVPLYEYAATDGRRAYSIDPQAGWSEYMRRGTPLCRVWANPFREGAK